MTGNDVAALRKKLELTQEEFGEKVGYTRRRITAFEAMPGKIPAKAARIIQQLEDEPRMV